MVFDKQLLDSLFSKLRQCSEPTEAFGIERAIGRVQRKVERLRLRHELEQCVAFRRKRRTRAPGGGVLPIRSRTTRTN